MTNSEKIDNMEIKDKNLYISSEIESDPSMIKEGKKSSSRTAKKDKKKKSEDFNIEEALKRLEEINTELAKSGTPLKDSMALYKEGVELAAKCKENLEGVEKEMEILSVQ